MENWDKCSYSTGLVHHGWSLHARKTLTSHSVAKPSVNSCRALQDTALNPSLHSGCLVLLQQHETWNPDGSHRVKKVFKGVPRGDSPSHSKSLLSPLPAMSSRLWGFWRGWEYLNLESCWELISVVVGWSAMTSTLHNSLSQHRSSSEHRD